MHIIKKLTATLFFLLFFAGLLPAQTVRLDYIGENPLKKGKPSKDTVTYIDVLRKFNWDETVVYKNGRTVKFATKKPDTLVLNEPATVNFVTTFSVNPQLLNQIFAIHFIDLSGSLLVKLNDETIAATGLFVKDRNNKFSALNLDDYSNFVFKDTLEKLDITYIPHPNINFVKLALAIDQKKRAEKNQENNIRTVNNNYALGFYYLAFAIVFMFFFFFFREKTENLYFSLFCLCASLSFLWDNFNFDSLDIAGSFLFVFSLEFLSIFFVKVLKNREKSKIPLLVILIISAISFLPSITYNYSTFFGEPIPLVKICIIAILTVYASISTLYFLIQGIGQKRWEARVVVIICSTALLVSLLTPVIIATIPNSQDFKSFWAPISYKIGLCFYPLSAAIVLGKRNGMNQKQLTNQVKSIEKLSHDNLEKEKEKQQLLESQNSELERKVKERTAEVERQKELIEIKNKAITDNINYAQRIQSAILPDIKLIYKALEESFILFLPKDIVSGDFYAFAEKNNRVLIIAGDCTGHGVSGAFMSMIGSSLLNQIINEKNIEEPAQILNQLNTSVIETFRQSENESNDGMDVSICSFDLFKKELQYAGANRPLWLIRNGEITVFRPDKFPIGGLQMARDRSFTNYAIQLQKNDTLYIFTDGYADQFGGGLGKKMMTAKFKEMLVSIQGMTMREQEHYLKHHFEHWKGSNEQVDDVLVIGIRV